MAEKRFERVRLILLAIGMSVVMLSLTVFANNIAAEELGVEEPISEGLSGEALTPVTVDTPESASTSDLSTSSKSVDTAVAEAGDTVKYTIVISNSGISDTLSILMTDTLPADVMYVSDSLTSTVPMSGAVETGVGYAGGVITWTGSLSAGIEVSLMFSATIDMDAETGDVITNSAEINGDGTVTTVSAATEVNNDTVIYLPILTLPLVPPTLNGIGAPGSDNTWNISWSPINGSSSYQLQESNNPDFIGTPTIYTVNGTSRSITHDATWNNEFFYRVRAVNGNGQSGDWSNIQSVVGAYLDNFDDTTSGWNIVRWTHAGGGPNDRLVKTYYETGNLIIQVLDKWDWGVASPLRKAPAVPYEIELRSQAANLGNLLSFGAVYAGDWSGNECIITDGTDENLYLRTECFNHFYNTNIINKSVFSSDELKLQWERIDNLVWCPNCHGSPMKRLSDDTDNWPRVEPIPSTSSTGWNVWRIEVRADVTKMYANNTLIAEYPSDRWLSDPYFGVFASTDEYNNSTWRVDYYKVTPLDE